MSATLTTSRLVVGLPRARTPPSGPGDFSLPIFLDSLVSFLR